MTTKHASLLRPATRLLPVYRGSSPETQQVIGYLESMPTSRGEWVAAPGGRWIEVAR